MDSDSESSAREEETFPGMCITGDGNDVKVGIILNIFCSQDHHPRTAGGGRTKRKIKGVLSCAGQPRKKASLNFPLELVKLTARRNKKLGAVKAAHARNPDPRYPTVRQLRGARARQRQAVSMPIILSLQRI